jgi:hypothetical protein
LWKTDYGIIVGKIGKAFQEMTERETAMKKILSTLIMVVVFFVTGSANALRCGSDLVNVGDFKYEVLERCGEPNSKEIVGFTLNDSGDRELRIEHWVYGPWNGYYYVMVFEGGILVEIVSRRKD